MATDSVGRSELPGDPMELSECSAVSSNIAPGGFTVGVDVSVDKQYNPGALDSEGGIGWITAIDACEGTVVVHFPVGNRTERGVLLRRLHHVVGAAPKRKAAPKEGTMAEPKFQRLVVRPLVSPIVKKLLEEWHLPGANVLVVALEKGLRKEKGWRRAAEYTRVYGTGKPMSQHMGEDEKLLFATDYFLLVGAEGANMQHLAHSWGRDRKAARRVAADFLERLGPHRKEDARCGKSVIDDPAFACARLTAVAEFVAERQLNAAVAGTESVADLNAEFAGLSQEEQLPYEQLAEFKRLRAPFTRKDLEKALVASNGYIPWLELAAATGNVAGVTAVRNWVMSHAGFEYACSTLMPTLSPGQAQLRLQWARDTVGFWLLCKFLRQRVLLCHFDEKW